jgi:hypothetical protein
MKRLALAVGLFVLGVGAAIPARADYGVARFHSGYCRVWPDTAMVPLAASIWHSIAIGAGITGGSIGSPHWPMLTQLCT